MQSLSDPFRRGLVLWAGAICWALLSSAALAQHAAQKADGPEKVDGKGAAEWIKHLGHEDQEEQETAIEKLLEFEEPPIAEMVAASAKLGDKLFATKYVDFTEQEQNLLDGLDEVMFEFGPHAVLDLVKLLDSKDDYTRASAAQFLGVLGPDARSAATPLRKALGDKHEAVRDMAAWALGEMRNSAKGAKGDLEKLVKDDPSPLVKISAALSLSQFAGGEAAATKEGDPLPPRVHPLLLKSLSHEDDFVRGYAAKNVAVLGELATDALPDLEKLLKDKNANVRYAAAAAYWDISGQPTVLPVLVELLQAKEQGVRESAVVVLGDMAEQAKPAVAALRKVAEGDASRRVRAAARDAIERIKNSAPGVAPET